MSTLDEESLEVLRFILFPKVFPPSVDALNITSLFPVVLVHHAMYTLFPEMTIGAVVLLSLPNSEDKAAADTDCCVRNEDAADTRVVATRDIHKEIPKITLVWYTRI